MLKFHARLKDFFSQRKYLIEWLSPTLGEQQLHLVDIDNYDVVGAFLWAPREKIQTNYSRFQKSRSSISRVFRLMFTRSIFER